MANMNFQRNMADTCADMTRDRTTYFKFLCTLRIPDFKEIPRNFLAWLYPNARFMNE